MSLMFIVFQRRISLFISYGLLIFATVDMKAIAESFPIELSGTAPEKESVTVNVYKPSNAVNGMLTLSAYDADAPREGQLVINGNPSIRLFNSLGVPENDKALVDITIATPASYWKDGDNKLTFYHVRSGGYSINGASVLFDGSKTPEQGPIATFSDDSIDFGNVNVGGISDSMPLTLANSGTEPLNISDISVSSGFTQANNCSEYLPADGSCIFDVQFSPKTSGEMEGALTITDNTKDKFHVINLSGMGATIKESSSDSLTVSPSASEILLYHDFNDENLHTYTKTDLLTTWDASGIGLKGDSVNIVRDPEENQIHGNVMRVFYAANSYGRQNNSGAKWEVNLSKHDELYFSYDVFFTEDAEFVLGGKLPGLMGGPVIYTGGYPADGTDGWSGRIMWRSNGKLIHYMYHADQPNKYGEEFYWDDTTNGQTYLQRGQWNRLEMRYVMNTPGYYDGRLQAWFNGRLVLDSTDVMYRMPGGEDVGIDRLLFSTFYGGGSKKWAPSADQYIYFDNFIVSTQPITHY